MKKYILIAMCLSIFLVFADVGLVLTPSEAKPKEMITASTGITTRPLGIKMGSCNADAYWCTFGATDKCSFRAPERKGIYEYKLCRDGMELGSATLKVVECKNDGDCLPGDYCYKGSCYGLYVNTVCKYIEAPTCYKIEIIVSGRAPPNTISIITRNGIEVYSINETSFRTILYDDEPMNQNYLIIHKHSEGDISVKEKSIIINCKTYPCSDFSAMCCPSQCEVVNGLCTSVEISPLTTILAPIEIEWEVTATARSEKLVDTFFSSIFEINGTVRPVNVSMENIEEDKYRGLIPVDRLNVGDNISYYIEAEDYEGHTTRTLLYRFEVVSKPTAEFIVPQHADIGVPIPIRIEAKYPEFGVKMIGIKGFDNINGKSIRRDEWKWFECSGEECIIEFETVENRRGSYKYYGYVIFSDNSEFWIKSKNGIRVEVGRWMYQSVY